MRFNWTKPGVPPIGPRPNEIAACTKPQHEDRHDNRSGVDGVAKDVTEHPHPDDLVNESADAGEEEEEIDQGLWALGFGL